jgi:hypothetical protein
MLIFFVLICVSLTLQSPVSLNIHNQSQVINLISPVYFMHGGRWRVIPDQEIDVNTTTRNHIGFDSGQNILEGALVYRIQRKRAESAQDESKHIQLLVAWRGKYTGKLHVRVMVIEHDRELDKDNMKKLYQKYWHLLNTLINPVGSNWLLNDTEVLATTVIIMNGGYRWDISISEGKGDNIERPLWLNVER